MPKKVPNLSNIQLYIIDNQYNVFVLFFILLILLLFNIIDRLLFED